MATTINQAWLDARGAGPYYLNTQNETYTLATNVTTNGTAFVIVASGITFDLGGYTITYDNATPITVVNGSFETGTGGAADNWSFTNAPHAARYAGTWLSNEIYDGSYGIKFSASTYTEYIECDTTVTLEANTTYCLSAMFNYGGSGPHENPGAQGYVSLSGPGLTTQTCSYSGTNYRGIQLVEKTFTTGGTSETYTVRLGIVGHASATLPFYIDDIQIHRYRTYGVATQAWNWATAYFPGITTYGGGTNATVKNGYIVQGQDNGAQSHGVICYTINGITLRDLNVTVQGHNCSCIYAYQMSTFSMAVHDNTLVSNVITITSRDNFDGTMMSGVQGSIYGNTLTGGCDSGISLQGTIASDVYNNTISLKVRYTNAFGIMDYGAGSSLHDNIISCGTGEYAARGISVGYNASRSSSIYNNTITVQGFANNQEYGGSPIGGAYGIQLEATQNAEVYGNTVTAKVNGTDAVAFRANSGDQGAPSGIYVHDNTFIAVHNGTAGLNASAIKLTEVPEGAITFEDNNIDTQESIVGNSADCALTLVRSHIIGNDTISSPHPFEVDYSSTPGIHTTITMLDTTFEDATSKNYVENANTYMSDHYGGAVSNNMEVNLDWTTTFQVNNSGNNPVYNANVAVEDVAATEVFSGTTDINGRAIAELREFNLNGSTKTTYSNFTATATLGEDEDSDIFAADGIKTITLTFPEHIVITRGSTFSFR